MSDEDQQGLQDQILANPARHPVVRQAGGLSQDPLFTPRSLAEARAVPMVWGYVQFPEFGFILLITVWSKNDKSDLWPNTKRRRSGHAGPGHSHETQTTERRMNGRGKLTAKGAKMVGGAGEVEVASRRQRCRSKAAIPHTEEDQAQPDPTDIGARRGQECACSFWDQSARFQSKRSEWG